jgi:predicted phosphodiesterase
VAKRTIVIGDLHGCADELDALLKACDHTAADQVIFVGDLVGKGPDSLGVLQRAIALKAKGVRGNHDELVLRWFRASPEQRKAISLKPAHQGVIDTLGAEEWKYLASLPLWLAVKEHQLLVVHGGLMPGVPLSGQREEDLLNLRSVTREGQPSSKVDGGAPWASYWKGPETVVFGHDAVRGLQRHPFAIGLDTGCVYGRQLSAVVFPGRELVQVPAKRAYA